MLDENKIWASKGNIGCTFASLFAKAPHKIGWDSKGGHLKPTTFQMDSYWNNVLLNKVNNADKIWLVGNVARDYIKAKHTLHGKKVITTIHPSKRNYTLYNKNKINILKDILQILKDE